MTEANSPNDLFWKRLAVVVVGVLIVCAAAWSYNQFAQGRAVQGIADLPLQMANAGKQLHDEMQKEMTKAQQELAEVTEPVTTETEPEAEPEPVEADPDVPKASDWWSGMSADKLNRLWWRITLECRDRFADPETGEFQISTESAAPLASELGISVRQLVTFWEKSQYANWRTERAPD